MNQRGGPIAKTWRDVATGGGGGGPVSFADLPSLLAGEVYGAEFDGDPGPIGVISPLYISGSKLGSDSPTRAQALGMIALGGL